MDTVGFDQLARIFGTATSRRFTLGTAVAGLVTGVTASATPAAGICRGLTQRCFPNHGVKCCKGTTCRGGRCRCAKNRRRCGNRCIPKRQCCRHGNCRGNQRCVRGRCRCASGRKLCQGRCVASNTCCPRCAGNEQCVNGTCRPVAEAEAGCGQGGPCRVFATSTDYTGDFDGLEGADQKCNQRAAAAGLPGTYMAWLSDTTSSPATRFLTQSTGPYLRTDDVPVASNWDELTGGELLVPIDRTEYGDPIVDDGEAWTNTQTDGTPFRTDPGLVCNDWTSGSGGSGGRVGETHKTDAEWTNSHSDPCNSSWGLYCFQQG